MKRRFTPQLYRCKQEHESEFVVEDSQRMKTRKCKTCGKKAEHVFIAAQREAMKATIVYEKPGADGRVERMYVDPKTPESLAIAEAQGFQRREIQGLHEMRRFERQVTREMRSDYERMSRGEAKAREEFYARYHSDLRSLMSRGDVDPFYKAMFAEAINQYNSGYSNGEPDFNFHNAAFS